MIIAVLSPAKSLNYQDPAPLDISSSTRFVAESEVLVKKLRTLSRKRIGELMNISTPLAQLNHERYAQWKPNPSSDEVKQAIFAFDGDVYTGLDAGTLNESQLDYTQNHIRILSGLYGLLRPLDLMQPYRLEMGTKLPVRRKKNLYEFWGDQITHALEQDFQSEDRVLINLASNEYFKSINRKGFRGQIIDVEFKEFKNGDYRIVSFFAKKARGLMTRYMIDNEIDNSKDLKDFGRAGYMFNPSLSTETNWVFTRDEQLK